MPKNQQPMIPGQERVGKQKPEGSRGANRERGYVEIEMAGKVYPIRFPLNALIEIGDHFDVPDDELENGLGAALSQGGLKAARFFLWKGMCYGWAGDDLTKDPNQFELTEIQVGRLIDTPTLLAAQEEIAIAMGASMPDPKPGDDQGNATGPQAGI